jgi:hypothetical protein
LLRAAGNLAVTGAAYGGLAGAGAGEGDLVERLPSAVGGAVAGGLLTPPLGGLAAGAGKVGGFVADHIAASRNPQKVSDRIVARAMVRAIRPTCLRSSLSRWPADQARPAAEVQNLTAADLAGPNTRAAAGNAVRHHGPARTEGQKLLRERQEGSETAFSQADRIDNQLSDIAGPGGSLATADRILADRSADGRRLYEAPMASSIDYESEAGQALKALYPRIPAKAKVAAEEILAMKPRADADAAGAATPFGQTGSGGPKPDSLARFIARNGGLALDAETADLPRTINGVGKLVHENGKSIDGFWRDKLIDAGYLPRDADGGQARDITNELYNLLERDLSGDHVRPEGWEAKGRARMTRGEGDHKEALRNDVVRDMLSQGRDPRTIDPAILDRAAEHLAGRQARTGTEAYDMAAATQEAIPSKADKLTPQHWDYLKQGLDKIVSDNKNPFGEMNPVGQTANELRREVVRATEEAVPGLKEARKIWRGHTEELGALREGAKAFSKPREQVHRDLEELSDTGRELYRLAAINAKKETIAGKGDHLNKAALVGNSPKDREVLQALLPDRETYNRLLGYMRNEKAMFETKAELGNSKTAERLADAADADTPHGLIAAAEAAGHIGTGNWRAAIADIWRYAKKIRPEFRAQVLDEVRKVILNPDPQALAAFEARLKADPSLAAPERGRLLKLVAQASTRVAAGQANRLQPAQSGREAPR